MKTTSKKSETDAVKKIAKRYGVKRISTNEAIVAELAQQVKAMLPLARLVASDRFTPMQRQALRDASGTLGLLPLLAELNRLGGEKSRKHIIPIGARPSAANQ